MTTTEASQDVLIDLLREAFAEPSEEDLPFEVGSYPAEVGTVLRVPDALLDEAGIAAPRSVCVLLHDDDGVLVVPIQRHPREVGAGEVLIPEEESPFSWRVALCAWCALRLSPRGLSHLHPIARIPTAGQVALVARSLTPPRSRLPEWRAWQRLVRRLEEGGDPEQTPGPASRNQSPTTSH